MKALLLISLFLVHACASDERKNTSNDAGADRATGGDGNGQGGRGTGGVSGGGGGGTGGGLGGSVGNLDAPTNDTRASDGAATPVDAAPGSQRDGRIPAPPVGDPPCAAESNAGEGKACPSRNVTVACTLIDSAGRALQCICSPILGDKWRCQPARDGGVMTAGLAP